MTQEISPEYMASYHYEADDKGDLFQVIIPTPHQLQKTDIIFQKSIQKFQVKVGLKGHIPFLSGRTRYPFKDITWKILPDHLEINFVKSDPKQFWDMFIADCTRTLPMDPQSMFVVALTLAQINQNEQASRMIHAAAKLMYPEAIFLITNEINNSLPQGQPLPDEIKSSLLRLVNEYKYYQACEALGQSAIFGHLELSDGIKYLRIGSENGILNCTAILGIILNPNEEPNHEFKDAEESKLLLSKVMDQSPRALYSMAKLIAKTTPLEAQKMMKDAIALMPELEEFPIDLPKAQEEKPTEKAAPKNEETKAQEEKPTEKVAPKNEEAKTEVKEKEPIEAEKSSSISTVLAVAGTIGAVAAAGALIFSFLKRRK